MSFFFIKFTFMFNFFSLVSSPSFLLYFCYSVPNFEMLNFSVTIFSPGWIYWYYCCLLHIALILILSIFNLFCNPYSSEMQMYSYSTIMSIIHFVCFFFNYIFYNNLMAYLFRTGIIAKINSRHRYILIKIHNNMVHGISL